MLILVTGLPGSGKTTFAKAYAAHRAALHLNSDVLRREMGLMGRYSPSDKKNVYEALLQRAREALLEGREVVVDSTFYRESLREPFRDLAETCKVPVIWVEIRAQEENIRERLKKPRPDSEADFAVYQNIRDAYEPLDEPHLVLQSDETPAEDMIAALEAHIATRKTAGNRNP